MKILSIKENHMATDQLTALNMMLATIGEAPVASYNSTIPEATQARLTLENVNREVQSMGLHCNTDYNVPYAPQPDTGYIVVDATILHIDPVYPEDDGVQRGLHLWDRKNRTLVWTKTVYCNTIYRMNFEDLPEAHKYYIAMRASRIYQQQVLGSDSLERFTADDEARARVTVLEIEMRSSDHRMLDYSPVSDVLLRRW
jgi:hypothetical protein